MAEEYVGHYEKLLGAKPQLPDPLISPPVPSRIETRSSSTHEFFRSLGDGGKETVE
jgi:hypothetical protein